MELGQNVTYSSRFRFHEQYSLKVELGQNEVLQKREEAQLLWVSVVQQRWQKAKANRTRQPDALCASLQARADTVFIFHPTKKVPFKVEALVDDWKHPEQQLYFINFD